MLDIVDTVQQAIGGLNDNIGKQKVDSSVLHIVKVLFPEPTLGQLFFIEFLKRATREQSGIPDLEKNAVCISTQSIATLGHELGLSNDTTQKYVKLYTALGLLRKQKFLDRLAFVMSLGIYSPPQTLEANLDVLIAKSRSRLREMAQNVKHRCQVYGLIEQGLTQKYLLLQTLLQPDGTVSKRILEQRMAEALILTRAILPQITAGDLRQIRVDSLLSLSRGTSDNNARIRGITESTEDPHLAQNPPRQDEWGLEHDQKSTQFVAQRRQDKISLPANLPVANHLVDAPLLQSRKRDAESPLYQQQQRFAQRNGAVHLPSLTHQIVAIEMLQPDEALSGEPSSRFQADKPLPMETLSRRSNTTPASNLSESAAKGDSEVALRNVYVDNIYQFLITYTLREPRKVAEFFAEQLEHDSRVYPKYQKLFFIGEGQPRDPHVLAAAFICTMVRLHRDRWNISNRPGGFFTKRCREYDAGVPADVEEWVMLYGALSPSQLQETLITSASSGVMPASSQPAGSQVFPSKPAPAPLLPLPTLAPTVQVEPARLVMSQEEARALVYAILHDKRTMLFRACSLRLDKEQPLYAVLVDASIPGGKTIHQTIVYSAQDWQRRLAAMKTWRDLIYPCVHSGSQAHPG